MPAFRPVDTDAEHHRILCELGLLDDMDNWPMYQAQEARFDLVDSTIGLELWRSHVNRPPGHPSRNKV